MFVANRKGKHNVKKSNIVLIILLLVTASVFGQESGMGFGLSTDGLNAKYWMSSTNAVEVTWNFDTALSADYLFDKPELLKLTDNPTPVFYGLGIGIGVSTDSNDSGDETTELDLGIRGIIGMSYYLSSYPIDIFIESTPTIKILGGGGFGFGGSLGIRYFF